MIAVATITSRLPVALMSPNPIPVMVYTAKYNEAQYLCSTLFLWKRFPS